MTHKTKRTLGIVCFVIGMIAVFLLVKRKKKRPV